MTTLIEKISPLPLGFGGAAISGEGGGYGFGEVSEIDALKLLNLAFEQGIKVYDTAPIYGFTLSEKRIGKAFRHNRDEVFIISKSGVTWHSTKRVNMTNDPRVTESMLHQSLKDLSSDYIDLYMIHWPDSKVDIRRPMEVLSKAKSQGKIRHIGLCNTFVEDCDKASEIDKIEVLQSQLNLFETDATHNLLNYAGKHQMSFMSWGTLDKGILTRTVHEGRSFEKSDCRSWAPWWKQMDKTRKFEKLEQIQPLLEKSGHSLLEIAIGFNLSFPEVSMVLCGAKTPEQLGGVVQALNHLPDRALVNELKPYL